jgi:hypothetical protein
MVILRATSILGGQNEDKGMMCSITLLKPLISKGTLSVNLLNTIDKICSCFQLNKVEGKGSIKQLPFTIKC